MPLFPDAQFVGPIPISNFTTGGTPKIGVVVHVVVGSASSALSEFKDAGEELSAHFIVAGPGDEWPDGHILQVLDTDDVAYAQEAGNWPPTAYIAIEFSGQPTTAMSAAQVAAGAAIVAWASGVHGIPLTGPVEHGEPGVTTHCHPNGQPDPAWGDHTCPGPIRLAQVPGLIAQAVAIDKPPAPTPAPNEEEQEMTAVVLPDGTIKVYAVSTAGHLIEYTRHEANQTNSVIDVTDEIGATGQILLAP